MIRRIFVEPKEEFANGAKACLEDLKNSLNLKNLESARILQRYDIQDLDDADYDNAKYTIFCEAPVETLYEETFPIADDEISFAVEYLPGQFDQRADSAEQCLQLMAKKRKKIACATVYVLKGKLSESDLAAVKKYLVNAVDSRIAADKKPETLNITAKVPADVKVVENFITMSPSEIADLHKSLSLAMSVADLSFCQQYFAETEKRNPTITEIRVLDTYWSDHCRHTTFLTHLKNVSFENGEVCDQIKDEWNKYLQYRKDLNLEAKGKHICLMDIALVGMRVLKKAGKLSDLEESDEINAASIVVPVEIDGKTEEWLVMFKNETHNHPTEIEPFGGAATCLGGAIRDPLSGRSYVYQAMRVTGAGDPRKTLAETLPGKLQQRKICKTAAKGYSSYGNQIGLATGQVSEVYHPGYVAKRLEIGAVVAAAPRSQVIRGVPEKGDYILLVGGATGRDGIGGATGSSKDHTEKALENSAEVQKGDAPMERKLQRLFRNKEASRLIKRCNDFGAGGVSVAIGELAPSLEIDLDKVTKKYEGLDGTELAISESQERMAVVVSPKDAQKYIDFAETENLTCKHVATVTDTGYLVMKWRGKTIVNLSRKFLDTNGTVAEASAKVCEPKGENPLLKDNGKNTAQKWLDTVADLNVCSQKGLIEMFDSSIGASAVLHPFGGKYLNSPADSMCSKISTEKGDTKKSTIFSWGFNPFVASYSPYHGAICAICESFAKIAATGGDTTKIYLTLQEYFEKLRTNPERWGKPLAALLGALKAQIELKAAAIGGKDSMSGSFNDLDVPPTLVSFAITTENADNVVSPEFKKAGNTVAFVEIEKDKLGLPKFADMIEKYALIRKAVLAKKVAAMRPIRSGGLAEAVTKSCLGNNLGFEFAKEFKGSHFDLSYGSIVVELNDEGELQSLKAKKLGTVKDDAKIRFDDTVLDLKDLQNAWENTLETVYPTKAKDAAGELKTISYAEKSPIISPSKVARPRVFIPVFPGTNCEYDSAKAFEEAGAVADIFVFKNRSDADIAASVDEMARRIKNSQIVMFPGGFSAGDEPAGSGKFIAAIFRNKLLTDAINSHIKEKKNLVLGICNGFQALIKLGLVPFGEVRPLTENSPTLTYNNISRHISCYATTRVASKLSPWFADCELGEEFSIPLSHGEGKFVAKPEVLQTLIKNGQVATQYVDFSGNARADIPFNPNGSLCAIEGITSPCGLVLGKMGHSERRGKFVGINISGEKFQPLFSAGVKYFA